MLLETAQITELAKPFVAMADSMKEFFENPQNKQAYNEWYLRKYGHLPEEQVTI